MKIESANRFWMFFALTSTSTVLQDKGKKTIDVLIKVCLYNVFFCPLARVESHHGQGAYIAVKHDHISTLTSSHLSGTNNRSVIVKSWNVNYYLFCPHFRFWWPKQKPASTERRLVETPRRTFWLANCLVILIVHLYIEPGVMMTLPNLNAIPCLYKQLHWNRN